MHTGKELEGSMHLGETLLFVTDDELSSLDAKDVIDIAKSQNCSGVYFGADLTMVEKDSYAKIAMICEKMPSTIELPISNRGRWLADYTGVRGKNGLHVIHRLDDMHGFPMAEATIIETDDLKIYSQATGQVITWRFNAGTMAVYPRDYEADQRIKY